MKEATADRDLVLHHTDTTAFSAATKPDDHSISPACARYPFTAGWTETMRVKCLVQGHNAMDWPGLELTTFRLRIQSLNSSATSHIAYIYTYIHIYIQTYIHTYIHTYIYRRILLMTNTHYQKEAIHSNQTQKNNIEPSRHKL